MEGLFKNVCYKHHSRNFDECILIGLTPTELRIKEKQGINVILANFMQQWSSVIKKNRKLSGRTIT